MADLILRRNLAPGTVPNTLALYGVAHSTATESVKFDVYWRFEDEPTMDPQFLGTQTAGYDLVVPLDLKGREIRLFMISKTEKGVESVRDVKEAVQTTFAPPTQPTLSSVEYIGTNEIELFFVHNGATADINIYRSYNGDDYTVIATVAYTTTTYVDDTATLDGEYSYYLSQDTLEGVSNIRTDTVTGESSGTGSPPSDLGAVYDNVVTVTLTWTNNSGTGLNHIEQKINPTGSWVEIGTVASGTATYDATVAVFPVARTYYFRVRNASVVGYSNEASAYIPAE